MVTDFEPLASILDRRAQQRTLLVTQQFTDLEALLEQQSQPWLNGLSTAYDYEWSIDTIFDPLQPKGDTLACLQRWVSLEPNSYYAHLLLGCYWELAATRIRTQLSSEYVEGDRWMGAELARDLAIATYLHALQLHAKPAYAAFRLFRLCCYLGEPQWITALAHGEEPVDYAGREAEVDPEIWSAGLERLRAEGGNALATIPVKLPACLSPRSGQERSDYKVYWLRITLEILPNMYSAIGSYAYYLYPRWGGSHEKISAFIASDWCRGLSEIQRNGLLITQAMDYIGNVALLPHPEDSEGIAFCHQKYKALFSLPLTGRQRASVLCRYAAFLAHYARTQEGSDVFWHRSEMQRAYNALVEAWQVDHPAADPGAHNVLSTLLSCLDFAGIEDTFGLRPLWLERSQQWGSSQYEVLVAGLASRYGFYGITRGQFDDEHLISLGLALESDCDLGQAAANLFESASEEAGVFMMHMAAEAGDASAMAGLYDLYSGKMSYRYDRDASAYEDRGNALYWMERAADAGNTVCQYNLAYVISTEREIEREEQYLRARNLFLAVLTAADADSEVWRRAARELSGLMLFNAFASEQDHKIAVERVLAALWNAGGEGNQEYAAAYYAHAFYTGKGCAANRYLAKIWVDRGLAIAPEDEYLQARAAEIYQRGEFLGGLRSGLAFRRGQAKMDESGRSLTFDIVMPEANGNR